MDAHDALSDVNACVEILHYMTRREEKKFPLSLSDFKEYILMAKSNPTQFTMDKKSPLSLYK